MVLLDLQDFILRARVLKLYRQALRTAQRAPGHTRGEVPIYLESCPQHILISGWLCSPCYDFYYALFFGKR